MCNYGLLSKFYHLWHSFSQKRYAKQNTRWHSSEVFGGQGSGLYTTRPRPLARWTYAIVPYSSLLGNFIPHDLYTWKFRTPLGLHRVFEVTWIEVYDCKRVPKFCSMSYISLTYLTTYFLELEGFTLHLTVCLSAFSPPISSCLSIVTWTYIKVLWELRDLDLTVRNHL